MFTKIKAALANLASRIAHRIYLMGIEAELASGVSKVETEFHAVVEEAKTALETLIPAAAVAAVVATAVPAAPVASASAPTTVVSVAGLISKVKSVLAVVEGVPVSFDTLADLAIKAAGPDIDAALGMFEKMLDLAGVKSAFWTEVVAAAKAI